MNNLIDFFQKLFDSNDFIAKVDSSMEWSGLTGLIFQAGNVLFFIACLAVTAIFFIALIDFEKIFIQVNKRLVYSFSAVFLAMGMISVLEASTLWLPIYRFIALFKLIVALAAFVLVRQLAKTFTRYGKKASKNFYNVDNDATKLRDLLRFTLNATNLVTFKWDMQNDIVEYVGDYHGLFKIKDEYYEANDYQSWHALVDPRDHDLVKSEIDKSVEDKSSINANYRLNTDLNKGPVYINTKAETIFDKDGKPSLMVGVHIDISDRIASEKKYQTIFNHFQIAMNSANAVAFFWDVIDGEAYFHGDANLLFKVKDKNYKIDSYDSWAPLIHPKDKDRADAHIEDVVKNNTPVDIEYRMCNPDLTNGTTYVHSKGEMIKDEQGKNRWMAGLTIDVEEVKKKSDELLERNAILNLAQDVAQVGHWYLDIDQQTVVWSKQIYEIHGVKPEEFKPSLESALEFYHPDDVEIVKASIQKTFEKHEDSIFDARIMRPNGEIRYVHSRAQAKFADHGELEGIFGIFIDQTDSVIFKKEISEKELRYMSILENNVDGVITIKADGTMETINSSIETMLGYTKDEMLGQNVKMIMPPFYALEHDDYLKNYLETGVKKIIGQVREVVAQRKDGSCFPAEISISEIKLKDERIFSGIIRDVSLKKAYEEDMKEKNLALEKSNTSLERFAFITSHDLQEPLRVVSSYVDLLVLSFQKEGLEFNEKQEKYSSYIKSAVQRMSSMIKDILEYSKIGQQGFNENVDISKIVESVKDVMLSIKGNEKLTIKLEGEFPVLTCRETEIYQVLQNLTSNAVKFQKEGVDPVVKISCKKHEDDTILFSVEDNGIGIEEENFKKIFDIFERVDKKSDIRGTGIGLTHTKKIIEDHGGKIWLESTHGKGTCFYFTIKTNLETNSQKELEFTESSN